MMKRKHKKVKVIGECINNPIDVEESSKKIEERSRCGVRNTAVLKKSVDGKEEGM